MKKTYLFTPGPTTVPPETLLEMAKPIQHHRTSGFSAIVKETRELLKWVFETEQEVIMLASSGTGAMEAAVVNTCSRGDTIVTINGGKFGERWGKLGKAYGLKVVEIPVEWGQAADPAKVAAVLDANPGAKALCWQANETSTGVQHPTRELAALCIDRPGTLSIVDGITAVGVFPVPMDAWKIDIVLSGSQKAFMLPPGLAMISLSQKAWAATKTADLPRFYFDLARELKNNVEANTTAWTPAVSLICGLHFNLKQMKEEGLPGIFARHDTMARGVRAACAALGLELLAPEAPSTAITAFKVPEGVDGKALKKKFDQRGVFVAGGQDHLTGKILRVGHMGYYDTSDMLMAIAVAEQLLLESGYPLTLGKGVGAASAVFMAK